MRGWGHPQLHFKMMSHLQVSPLFMWDMADTVCGTDTRQLSLMRVMATHRGKNRMRSLTGPSWVRPVPRGQDRRNRQSSAPPGPRCCCTRIGRHGWHRQRRDNRRRVQHNSAQRSYRGNRGQPDRVCQWMGVSVFTLGSGASVTIGRALGRVCF